MAKKKRRPRPHRNGFNRDVLIASVAVLVALCLPAIHHTSLYVIATLPGILLAMSAAGLAGLVALRAGRVLVLGAGAVTIAFGLGIALLVFNADSSLDIMFRDASGSGEVDNRMLGRFRATKPESDSVFVLSFGFYALLGAIGYLGIALMDDRHYQRPVAPRFQGEDPY
jgi:hypothetical protein